MLTLDIPCISESCIEIKIKFLFSHFFVVPQKVLWRLRLKQDNYSWAKLQITVRRKWSQKKTEKRNSYEFSMKTNSSYAQKLVLLYCIFLNKLPKNEGISCKVTIKIWKHDLLHFMEIRHSVIHIWLINQFAPLNLRLLIGLHLFSS